MTDKKYQIFIEDEYSLVKKAHLTDSGYDLKAEFIERKGNQIIYHTGVFIALPKNISADIRPRSSIRNYDLIMRNSPGTIDEDYTGELIVTMDIFLPCNNIIDVIRNLFRKPKIYNIGDNIAQLVITERLDTEFVIDKDKYEELIVVKNFSRGSTGHGDSDKKSK